MKDNFVVISDVHFNLNNLSPAADTLRRALDEAMKRKCDLFIAGDLNDQKAILRAEVVELLITMFKAYSSVSVYVLIGNHDLHNNHSEEHSLEFLKLLPNVTVISKPTQLGQFSVIPYIHDVTRFREELSKASRPYLLMHQGVRGANLSDKMVDDFSLSPEEFLKFKTVFTGHYHGYQELEPNIRFFGSPYTVDFSEANQKKYIHYVSVKNGLVHELIETGTRRHHQLEFKDPSEIVQASKNHGFNSNDLLKVVLHGDRHFITSVSKDHLKAVFGCDRIVIVPMVTKQSTVRMDISRSSKPIDVMLSYLESAEVKLDKSKLKTYAVEIVK